MRAKVRYIGPTSRQACFDRVKTWRTLLFRIADNVQLSSVQQFYFLISELSFGG